VATGTAPLGLKARGFARTRMQEALADGGPEAADKVLLQAGVRQAVAHIMHRRQAVWVVHLRPGVKFLGGFVPYDRPRCANEACILSATP